MFEQMKKEMGEEYMMEHRRGAPLARVCAEYLLEKLKPSLSLLSPNVSKHKSEYDRMVDKLICMNPVVDETNTFMYDISKYLVDTVKCWISCMRSYDFDDQLIRKALYCIKGKVADYTCDLEYFDSYDYSATNRQGCLSEETFHLHREIKQSGFCFQKKYISAVVSLL